MNFELSDDQRAFQDAARNFARKEFEPHAARWDEQSIFPREAIAQAGAMGFCGLYTSTSHGGMGLSRLDAHLIFEELARYDPSTTAFITIHNMATWMVSQWAQAEFAQELVPSLASGELLASYCLTEPNAGSDAASLRTRAEVDGDDYLITGNKVFISGAGATNWLVVMARTSDDGARGISAFAVDAQSAGIEYGKKEAKLGWNSQPTRAIAFNRVRVPARQRLGEEGDGFKIAMRGLDGGRINIATCSLGAAQGALQTALDYVRSRKQFGQELAQFQSVQYKLADMLTELVAARQMVRLAAAKLDASAAEARVYCAMAKRFATDVGFTVCNEALQLHGGYGYIKEYPLERLLRDVRVHQILEGTNEIMRLIVGRHALDQDNLDGFV
nr:acyl-CoA dehydrogenase family protein [Oceanococcus sp. HetDA_MAG_MS8]